MSDPPAQLDYATPATRRPAVRDPASVYVAGAAVVVGFVAFIMPPIAGSGRISHNVFYTPTWCVAFSIAGLYFCVRLVESKPGCVVGPVLAGLGALGAIASLGVVLLNWHPNVPVVSAACVGSFAVAAVGRWITSRCCGPARVAS